MALQLGAGITAVIPAHPPRMRNGMVLRAVESVGFQHHGVEALVVEVDQAGHGAAATRNRGVAKVATRWTAFLDSDDWWYPEHLEVLAAAQAAGGADYVYSYFSVYDAWEALDPAADPLGTFGEPFDPLTPTQTTITVLVRTELLHHLADEIARNPADPADAPGPFMAQPAGRRIPGTPMRYGEDFDFTVRAAAAGATILHVPQRTWAWRIHGGNSAGLSGTGDAPMPAGTT